MPQSGTTPYNTNEPNARSPTPVTGFQRPYGLWLGVSGDSVPRRPARAGIAEGNKPAFLLAGIIPMSAMNDPMPLGVAGLRRLSGDAVPRHPQPKAERPLETGYRGNGSNIKLVSIIPPP